LGNTRLCMLEVTPKEAARDAPSLPAGGDYAPGNAERAGLAMPSHKRSSSGAQANRRRCGRLPADKAGSGCAASCVSILLGWHP